MVAPAVKVPADVPLSLERCLAAGGPVPQPALHVTREPAQYKRLACHGLSFLWHSSLFEEVAGYGSTVEP
jgi:hypothetical protein